LSIPLDIIIVKKIPFPGNPEYAIGAVGMDEVVIDREVVAANSISDKYIDGEVKELTGAIKERYRNYRGDRPLPGLKGKTVILTDDGLATGHTMLAAVDIVKRQGPKKIVLAVPVAPPETIRKFEGVVDEVVCLDQPSFFFAIGQFYEDFGQVEDEEAIRLLKEANG
jgi:predicted phosphoribosyltransferase